MPASGSGLMARREHTGGLDVGTSTSSSMRQGFQRVGASVHDAVADRVGRRDVPGAPRSLAVQSLFTLGRAAASPVECGELQRGRPRVDRIDDDCASIAVMDPQFNLLDRYWRAANYLTVGQIYLPRQPAAARAAHRGPHQAAPARPLGDIAGAVSFVYVHLNRLIRERDANVIYIAGPGHGGPALVANVYLEGTYSEVYPDITEDEDGMLRLFRQFSTPGGIPSHVSAPTPGSIHEGGELGYALVHAFGAAFDNPDLIVACVIGDGEAETGPLEGSWKGVRFLHPNRDGAVLPILHLNGYKISGPDGARPHRRRGRGRLARTRTATTPSSSRGTIRQTMHEQFAGDARRRAHEDPRDPVDAVHRRVRRPRWPAIILRSPKGWTGPEVVDGVQVGGTFRAHQVPLAQRARQRGAPRHARGVDAQLRARRPVRREGRRSSPSCGPSRPKANAAWVRTRTRTAARCPCRSTSPTTRTYSVDVPAPATVKQESTRRLGELHARHLRAQPRRTSACSARTRRSRTGSARCSRSRTAARWIRSVPTTTTWLPTAA